MNDRLLKYLDYIVDDLISNTEIKKLSADGTGKYVLLPWNNVVLQSDGRLKRLMQYDSIPYKLVSYLENNFGLETEKQMDYVWDIYKDFLIDLLYNKK